MNRNSPYYAQVQLLIRLLPMVAAETCFALKGGTAINLFVRDFPRLSVDIDLVYLLSSNRAEALADIRTALDRLADAFSKVVPGIKIVKSYNDKQDALRLVVERNSARIKIELSPVSRGTVYPSETRSVVAAVEDEFGFAETQVVSFEDLFAGKICAALDRQHPRDLFDIRLLLANEGLTASLKQAFLAYLISHQRPMEELLAPNLKDLSRIYTDEFEGMTQGNASLDELEQARADLIVGLHESLDDNDKRFLCSVYERNPQWALLGLDGIDELPAVQWKLKNIEKMPGSRRAECLKSLKHILKQN